MLKDLSVCLLITTVVGLAALAPSPPALAQSSVVTYEPSHGFLAGTGMAYDWRIEEFVLAQIRDQDDPTMTRQVVELIFGPASPSPSRFAYFADFLDIDGGAGFEIPSLLADLYGHVVFVNKWDNDTDTWGSWAIRTDRDHNVVWGHRLQAPGVPHFRVLEAVSIKNGSAALVSFDTAEINGRTAVLVLDFDGNVSWARSYAFAERVDLNRIHGGREGLIVGGFLSDLDSEDLGELVLLEIAPLSGAPGDARHYHGVTVDAGLAMASAGALPGTQGGLHVVGQTTDNTLAFVAIDPQLEPDLATLVELDAHREAVDLAFLPDGGLLTLLDPPFGGASEVLQMTDLNPQLAGDPVIWEVAGVAGFDDVDLRYAAQATDHVVLAGVADANGSTAFQSPLAAVQTDSDGNLPFCVPQRPQAPQVQTKIQASSLIAFSVPLSLESIPIFVGLWSFGGVLEVDECQ